MLCADVIIILLKKDIVESSKTRFARVHSGQVRQNGRTTIILYNASERVAVVAVGFLFFCFMHIYIFLVRFCSARDDGRPVREIRSPDNRLRPGHACPGRAVPRGSYTSGIRGISAGLENHVINLPGHIPPKTRAVYMYNDA